MKLFGVETLLRWNNPAFPNTSIELIISIAEDSGLIVEIGDWIINEAFRQYKEWQLKDNIPFKFSLNISPRQLHNTKWAFKVKQFIETYKIDPHTLIFELTETNVIKNIDAIQQVLKEVAELGVQIYIDDFGMGYSSLSMIKNFRIAGLKIDKSSIQHIVTDADALKLVESLFLLAKNMGYIVIAEGIETQEQLDILKSHASGNAQGFYLAQPMPSNEIVKLLMKAGLCK